MSDSVQNIIVLSIVGVCVIWLGWQLFGALVGKRSKVGSCCTKGCEPARTTEPAHKTAFMPVEMLSRRH